MTHKKEIMEVGEQKVARIPIKVIPRSRLQLPKWIKAPPITSSRFMEVKKLLREKGLVTVCEQASCPNITECFGQGTATFMILGNLCTRRCPFCDVPHGRPFPPDPAEPGNLANAVASLGLSYVVITSVDRDDLMDGGAQHFVDCVTAVKCKSPRITVELLVPDFRGKLVGAIEILSANPPHILNHNLETVPRLYKDVRPGANYLHSLGLLQTYKSKNPQVITKSGLMVGLGETEAEILEVMQDLRAANVDMLTIGQYLQPTEYHLPVIQFVTPAQFELYRRIGRDMGFVHVASGPMVRSSYHADEQATQHVSKLAI